MWITKYSIQLADLLLKRKVFYLLHSLKFEQVNDILNFFKENFQKPRETGSTHSQEKL